MNTKTLLASCADAVVRTSDGKEFPASKFTCVSSCSVLRDLVECTKLKTTEDGRTIFPVPHSSSSTVALVIDLLHNVRRPEDLQLKEMNEAFAGLDLFGCDHLHGRLLDQLWRLVERTDEAIDDYALRLLQSPCHKMKCLSLLVKRMPLWSDFMQFLEDVVPLDAEMAVFLGSHLIKFFPPDQVIYTLLDLFPFKQLSPSLVYGLVGTLGSGVYYHPSEATRVLITVKAVLESRGWDAQVTEMLKTIVDGHRRYEVAPSIASKIHGTVFMYDGSPVASALLIFDSGEGGWQSRATMRSITVTPWLRVHLRPSGVLYAWLQPWKMDQASRMASAVQLRVTAAPTGKKKDEVKDVWWTWDNLQPSRTMVLSTFTTQPQLGDLAAVQAIVRSGVRSIRFDVHYGAKSILERPLGF